MSDRCRTSSGVPTASPSTDEGGSATDLSPESRRQRASIRARAENCAAASGAEAVWHPGPYEGGIATTLRTPRLKRVGSSVTSTRRKIEVVVVVGGLVLLFGFLALVILSLYLGIG